MATVLDILASKHSTNNKHRLHTFSSEGIKIMTDAQSSKTTGEEKFDQGDNGNGILYDRTPEQTPYRRYASLQQSQNVVSESSSQSLEEVFGTHFDEGMKSPVSRDSFSVKSPANEDWNQGDAESSFKDDKDDEEQMFTAPIKLYMPSEGSLGFSSGTNGKSSNYSMDSFGKNNLAESPATQENGSISSTGSTPNSIPRPLLYSAIGSLESPNQASLGSFAKRLTSGVLRSTLIPPPTSTNSVAGTRHENFDSESKTTNSPYVEANSSTSGSSKTPVAHNHKSSSDADGSNSSSQIEARNSKQLNNAGLEHSENGKEYGKSKIQKPSNLKRSAGTKKKGKRVSYDKRDPKKQVEMFRPSCDAYTPRIEKKNFKYRKAEQRTPVQTMATTMGTLQRPNFRDALRRVAMIMHQHIVKIEGRFERTDMKNGDLGLFTTRMRDAFSEENFCTPTYKCTMVRIPMARPGMIFGLRKIKTKPAIPSEEEIYEFAHQLFKSVQLSSECSIVCLIYVERLMEVAKVPLLACTWRPIFMCGLLLASKVWQDLSSWNIEFASVYPQFSLDSINKLEVNFLRNIKWDLYISSSLYAKYYFALRSLVEKVDFRQRYNRMVGGVDSVAQSEALKIQKRSEAVKEEALLQISRSM